MAFCIETVKDVLNFDFFPGVQINKFWPSSSSGIRVPPPQLFMCKSNAISPVSIVFIEQGNAPVITIDFSLSIATEINLGLERYFASWLRSRPTHHLCVYLQCLICISFSSLGGTCMVVKTQMKKMAGHVPYIGYFFGHVTI